jgi:hypothetical protein
LNFLDETNNLFLLKSLLIIVLSAKGLAPEQSRLDTEHGDMKQSRERTEQGSGRMDSQQMVEAAGSAYSMKLENIDSS